MTFPVYFAGRCYKFIDYNDLEILNNELNLKAPSCSDMQIIAAPQDLYAILYNEQLYTYQLIFWA